MASTKQTAKRGRPAERRRHSLQPDLLAVGSYFDSIYLSLPRALPPKLNRALCKSIGPHAVYGQDVICLKSEKPNYTYYQLAIHRPAVETIKLVQKILGLRWPTEQGGFVRATMVQVDVALDFLTPDVSSAVAWVDFLEHRLLDSTRSTAPVSREYEITYYRREIKRGRSIKLYADKPFRLKSIPWEGHCCHLECEIKGVQAMKRMLLASPDQLLDFDHRVFWNAALDLRLPASLEKLARASNGATNSRQPQAMGTPENVNFARQLLDQSKNSRGVVVAQTLLNAMRAHGGRFSSKEVRLFRPESHTSLLPSSMNAHWHPIVWAEQGLTV